MQCMQATCWKSSQPENGCIANRDGLQSKQDSHKSSEVNLLQSPHNLMMTFVHFGLCIGSFLYSKEAILSGPRGPCMPPTDCKFIKILVNSWHRLVLLTLDVININARPILKFSNCKNFTASKSVNILQLLGVKPPDPAKILLYTML